MLLVADAPAGSTLLVVAIATAGAAALGLLGRTQLSPPAVHALAGLTALATLALALAAAGLPWRLLAPDGWDQLFDGLDRGLGGVRGVDWPYDGPDEWVRLTILLGAPFLLAVAAAVAFWPARRAAPPLRAAGLAVLLFLYGAGVTENDPGAPLLRGLGLLLLVAAWLWLPRMATREAGVGAAVVLGVGVCALPIAAALDGDRPWWDYRAWDWFGRGEGVTFSWNHEYGPLEWPRKGTTLLNVRSERPHYWKAEVLDGFDGFRWFNTGENAQTDVSAGLPYPFRAVGRKWNFREYNPAWDHELRVTVRSMRSDLLIGTGVTHDVDGAQANPTADGTTRLLGEPLEKGDSYTIRAYVPDPSADQMRRSERLVGGYPPGVTNSTGIYLPRSGESATEGAGLAGDGSPGAALAGRDLLVVRPRGAPWGGTSDAPRLLRRSAYREMYELARALAAGKKTAYDVVKAIESHLRENYSYSERVPTRPIPLSGFLFQDGRGYCQQFSGAMALMLRMLGIPARVATGFTPGSYNKDTGEYRVRDLDAHSWVEVYFTGIGWVPFDPTPADSPAESQAVGPEATSAARADVGEIRQAGTNASALAERGTDLGTGRDGGGGVGWLAPALILPALALAGGAGAYAALALRRRRRLGPERLAEAQIAELRDALAPLDWEVPPATTLRTLEQRLQRRAAPAAAAYAGALRAHRYDPRAPAAPGAAARRAARRDLGARGGTRRRLRALLAMPPGGPRPTVGATQASRPPRQPGTAARCWSTTRGSARAQ
jgi:transglutaminase-like putative cysteine protease